MSKCKSCGQPMLPKGAVKREGEYDHAWGCPEDPHPVSFEERFGPMPEKPKKARKLKPAEELEAR